MKPTHHITTPTIAIVGGGVSGSLTAIQLLRSATSNLDIHLIERSGVFGRGAAYGTEEYSSLLNVPAGKMSAFPDDPKHFWRWLQMTDFRDKHGQAATETSFIPRHIYGRYICETLNAAEYEAKSCVRLIRHADVVLDIEVGEDRALLCLQSGDQIHADKVVVALGNFQPRDLPFIEAALSCSHRYVKNPWASQAIDHISADDSVLIIGTGLTMADVVLALHARGHRGNIFAVSKHGLLPQAHRLSPTTITIPQIADLPNTARELMRYVRQQVDMMARTEQTDWRLILDALRSLTPLLWQRLPINEKRRLLRHVQPYWDIHRHRMPAEAAAIIDELCKSGQLVIHKGCFTNITLNDLVVQAEVETGAGNHLSLTVQNVINCTGPNTNYVTSTDPLLKNLFKRGLAQSDCLQLGLDADNNGALRDQLDSVSKVLYTLGPLLKGTLWESTAVPEIRQQATKLAEILLTDTTIEQLEQQASYSR